MAAEPGAPALLCEQCAAQGLRTHVPACSQSCWHGTCKPSHLQTRIADELCVLRRPTKVHSGCFHAAEVLATTWSCARRSRRSCPGRGRRAQHLLRQGKLRGRRRRRPGPWRTAGPGRAAPAPRVTCPRRRERRRRRHLSPLRSVCPRAPGRRRALLGQPVSSRANTHMPHIDKDNAG